jgi:hypothetical protein
MKTRIIMMLFLGLIITTTACKKKDGASEEDKKVQMMRQKILGYWHLVEFIEETKVGNNPPEIINNDPKNIYFEFFANGRVKTNAEGEDEFDYDVKANNKLLLWNNEQTIVELTENKLTFKNTATSQGTTYTQTYYLTR